jgi:hypothetical protein
MKCKRKTMEEQISALSENIRNIEITRKAH